jgi:hypothetical protein
MNPLDVQGSVQYLVPGEKKPIYFASQGGADAALNISAQFEERTVSILDARALPAPASLDAEGFTLVAQRSGVANFYEQREHWLPQYETELRELYLDATGGLDIHIFDHTLRSDSAAVRGEQTTREPATVIHNDYTDASAVRRVRDLLEPEVAEQWLAGRFAIINAWRSINGPVLSSPLALCDARTIAGGDLVASERRAEERVGELELVCWNPSHRWYYYPAMRREEVLLIKTFDSASDGRATRSIHTAFRNPLAATGTPPRESIESRAIVRFG